VHALTTDQIVVLSTDEFAAFSSAQIAQLTTAQAHALTTDQIVAFSTAQIAGLSTADIAAMTTAQVAAFESRDIQVMSNDQINALLGVTPIVLDLDGNGIQTMSAANGVTFDVTATGNTAHKVGWVGGGDALLVRDVNHDGVINNGTELFGTGTQLANGQRAGNGYAALADLDSNHDGKISAADAHFKDLQLWVDANHDGKTDKGELHGLGDFGIVSLDLSYKTSTQGDNGNLLGMVSSYTKSDGTSHAMADVYFTKDMSTTSTATPATTPKLGDLLAAPQAELLHGSADSSLAQKTLPASSSQETLHAAFMPHRLLDDEQHRQAPLL